MQRNSNSCDNENEMSNDINDHFNLLIRKARTKITFETLQYFINTFKKIQQFEINKQIKLTHIVTIDTKAAKYDIEASTAVTAEDIWELLTIMVKFAPWLPDNIISNFWEPNKDLFASLISTQDEKSLLNYLRGAAKAPINFLMNRNTALFRSKEFKILMEKMLLNCDVQPKIKTMIDNLNKTEPDTNDLLASIVTSFSHDPDLKTFLSLIDDVELLRKCKGLIQNKLKNEKKVTDPQEIDQLNNILEKKLDERIDELILEQAAKAFLEDMSSSNSTKAINEEKSRSSEQESISSRKRKSSSKKNDDKNKIKQPPRKKSKLDQFQSSFRDENPTIKSLFINLRKKNYESIKKLFESNPIDQFIISKRTISGQDAITGPEVCDILLFMIKNPQLPTKIFWENNKTNFSNLLSGGLKPKGLLEFFIALTTSKVGSELLIEICKQDEISKKIKVAIFLHPEDGKKLFNQIMQYASMEFYENLIIVLYKKESIVTYLKEMSANLKVSNPTLRKRIDDLITKLNQPTLPLTQTSSTVFCPNNSDTTTTTFTTSQSNNNTYRQ